MVYFVDHADDRAINGAIFVAFSQPRRRTTDDDHFLVKARSDGVNGDNIAALVSAVEIDRLDDEQLFAFQAFVFLRGHDSAQYACDDHKSRQQQLAVGR